MDTSLESDSETLMAAPEASSVISLLERGIQCARQGAYAEGVAFFALAREQLTSEWASLAAAIDAIVKSNVNYWQAQQMLHLASKRFAEADVEQKNSLHAIENLLPALSEETAQDTQPLTQPQPLQLFAKRVHPSQKPSHVQAASTDSRASHAMLDEPALGVKEKSGLPGLSITCFGHFEVRRRDATVPLCQNRSGQTVLRYLIAQPKYSASRDALMAILWPEDAPEVALHKLQIAVSALRRSLNRGYSTDAGGGYILYKEPFYLLNPAVALRTDVDEFLALWQAGRSTGGSEAIKLFEQAMCLYTNAFLVEDMYADWSSARREKLSQVSLSMCRVLTSHYLEAGRYEEAEKWAIENLKGDRCDEKAHRQLMQIYFAQGQRGEALRQYQRCKQILAEELGIAPTPETVNLLQTLLANETSPQRRDIEQK
jgi:DNA-binding SARP family transcriptional activator